MAVRHCVCCCTGVPLPELPLMASAALDCRLSGLARAAGAWMVPRFCMPYFFYNIVRRAIKAICLPQHLERTEILVHTALVMGGTLV